MIYRYFVFGLYVESEIEIPQFLPAESKGIADVQIFLRETPEHILKDLKKRGATYELAPSEFLLGLENIARYHVVNGNKIFITLKEKTDLRDVSLFLVGSCFGALLLQRGTLPLHASGFVYDDQAVLISGLSGMGKSTTANAIRLKGYKLITDDICPIEMTDGYPYAIPGYPQSKLWEDALENLNIEFENLPKVRKKLKKRIVRMPNSFEMNPKPIRCIYILGIHQKPTVELQEIDGADRFIAIKNMTYRNYFIEGLDSYPAHFKNCISIANHSVPMKFLIRPSEFSVPEVVNTILEDIEKINIPL